MDITDWAGKVPGTKQKWWEAIVTDLTVELMEGKLELFTLVPVPKCSALESQVWKAVQSDWVSHHGFQTGNPVCTRNEVNLLGCHYEFPICFL